MKSIKLYVLGLGVGLSLALTFVISPTASAWTTNPTQGCYAIPELINTVDKAITFIEENADAEYVPEFNTNMSFVLSQDDNNTTILYLSQSNIEFDYSPLNGKHLSIISNTPITFNNTTVYTYVLIPGSPVPVITGTANNGVDIIAAQGVSCIQEVSNVTYVQQYIDEGGDIDYNGGGPESIKGAVPNITWEYDNLDIGFRSDRLKNSNVNLDTDYKIYWYLSNISFDPGQAAEDVYTVTGCSDVEEMNNHTVYVLGEYVLQAYYADRDCNILSRDLDGKLLNSNEIKLTLDGGADSGSTDIDSREFTDAQRLQIAFRNAINSNRGIEGLLLAPLEVVYHVAAWDGACEPIVLPILGSNEPMGCIKSMITGAMPVVATLITVAVNGTVAWLLVLGLFKQIKRTFDPDYNKVEVFSL